MAVTLQELADLASIVAHAVTSPHLGDADRLRLERIHSRLATHRRALEAKQQKQSLKRRKETT